LQLCSGLLKPSDKTFDEYKEILIKDAEVRTNQYLFTCLLVFYIIQESIKYLEARNRTWSLSHFDRKTLGALQSKVKDFAQVVRY
jgi:hypothetical protein